MSPNPFQSTPIVGQSSAVRALRARIRRLGPASYPVLILGETGVGKELAAQALHEASERAGPFVAVNCATLRPDLVAAELFGSRPGGFTGATSREGLCVQAHRGTLFLDEVGELPLDAQAMLLRVLSLKQVRPVGGHTSRAADFRLLCATHRDLDAMVAAGTFRADLLHRIDTLRVRVAPLRERLDDLPLLARHFVGGAVNRFDNDAWSALRAHRWPGNVRELVNVLKRATIENDGRIGSVALGLVQTGGRGPSRAHGAAVSLAPLRVQMGEAVARAVQACGGNVRAAARVLQISPTTAYRYLGFSGEPC